MMPGADTDDAAHIEQMQSIARTDGAGNVTNETLQGASAANCPQKYVTGLYLGQAPRCEFKVAVRRTFAERLDGDDVTR